MERKTAGEMLKDSFGSHKGIMQLEGKHKDYANSLYSQYSSIATEAMHAYAQQMAVEFAEFIAEYCRYVDKGRWRYQNIIYTTSDLYKLFTQQNTK